MQQKIFLSPPHMTGKEILYIKDAFKSNWVAPLGPHVDAFEEEISEKFNVNKTAVLSSGTAGVHLALKVIGIKRGDYVICSSFTFAGGVFPVLYEGAIPIFIDSDFQTWNMSPDTLYSALKDLAVKGINPKAIIVTNIYGQSADYDRLLEIGNNYNIPIIEDAAESVGSTYKNHYSGTLGLLGVFSFNGNKIITTGGGGALISNDEQLINDAKRYATQSRDNAIYYQHSKVGYNYRMSNISAAIGRAQLKMIDHRVEKRREIFQRYMKNLSTIEGISFMPEATYGRSNRWLTVMIINPHLVNITRDNLMSLLNENGIESRPAWKPMHMQPVFRDMIYYANYDGNNVSEYIFNNGICLPSGSNLKSEQQNDIIGLISDYFIGTKNNENK